MDQLDEDSSYDSDTELVNSPHQNVSRNVSETLAQELLDISSVSIFSFSFRHHPSNTGSPTKYTEIVVVSSFFFFSLRSHTLRRRFISQFSLRCAC